MTKLVNLDELASVERTLQFKGVKHSVIDLPVTEFIAFQAELQTMLKAQGENDVKSMMSAAKGVISRCVPSFEDFDKLNLRQLMATVELVTSFYPETEENSGNE